jgi:hypothetical protein
MILRTPQQMRIPPNSPGKEALDEFAGAVNTDLRNLVDGMLRWVTTAPASPTSAGVKGDCVRDGDYLYICIATNTWRRATLGDTW